MKRVVLLGYYGFNNAGDEAILYSIIRSLKQRDKKIQITVLSHQPEKTMKTFGVDAKNRWKWNEILSTLLTHDVLVFGGGSLLQDVTSVRSLHYYLGIANLAIFLRKKVYFMGQGIGPFKSVQSQKKVVNTLNKVDVITLRDVESKQALLDLGVRKPKLELTADAVLSLYRHEIEKIPGEKVLDRNGIDEVKREKCIGLSVRDWGNLSNYKHVLAKLGDYWVEQGYHLVLIPFHFPDDVTSARDVAKAMDRPVTVLKEVYSTIEMLGIIGNMKMLIGMRLHSLIMATVMAVPAIGLSYDPKIEASIKETGQILGGRVENLDLDRLVHLSTELLHHQTDYSEKLIDSSAQLRTRSRRNLDILMDMLEGSSHE